MNSPAFTDYFKLPSNFIPYPGLNTTTTTVKEVRVKAYVINYQNNAVPNFPDDAFNRSEIRNMFEYWPNNANSSFRHLDSPTRPQPGICGSCYIEDAKLRINLVGIDFINRPINDFTTSVETLVDRYSQDHDSVLSLFIVNHFYRQSATHPGDTGIGGNADHSYGRFQFQQYNKTGMIIYQPYFSQGYWGAFNAFMHELMHNFGFLHMYPYGGGNDYCNQNDVDYLKDIFGTGTNATCPLHTLNYNDCGAPNSPCSNNLMDYRGGAYLSPIQLGRIHRNSYISSISRYVYPTEAPSTTPWNITADQTWDFGIRMYQDIIVKSGKTLTIKCEVQMPPNGKIVVEKGAKLILDGGNITAYHPKTSWKGIELYGDKTQEPYPQHQGSLEMINESTIEYAELGVQDFISGVWNGGGIILAANSTFKDCRKSVGLNDYPDYPRGSSCSFYKVKFITENQAAKTNRSLAGIGAFTSYNERGVLISQCTFENSIPVSAMAMDDRSVAIYSMDAGFRIEGSSFKGFKTAVYPTTASNTPLRTVKVINNTFEENGTAIRFADNFSFAQDNHISRMTGYLYTANNIANYRLGSGIEAENAGGLTITRNTITQEDEFAIGITVTDTRDYGGRVIDNVIDQTRVGIQTQKDNPNLDLLCNTISNNSAAAFAINPQSPNGYILKNQGSGCTGTDYRAGNKFSNNARDIMSSLSNNWGYWYWQPDPAQIPQNNSGTVLPQPCTGTGEDPNSQCNLAGSVESDIEAAFDEAYTSWPTQEEGPMHMMRLSYIVSGFNDRNDRTGLIKFFEKAGTDDARKMLIPLYIESGRYSDAQGAVQQLELPQGEKTLYQQFYDVLIRQKTHNQYPSQMPGDDASVIREIAARNIPGLSGQARSILEYAFNEPWHHVQEQLSDDQVKHTGGTAATILVQKAQLLDAVPNPAQGKTRITVRLPLNDSGHASLQIRNGMGQVVKSYVLNGTESTTEVFTAELPVGIYLYSLVVDGQVVATRKLIIAR